MCRSVSLCSIEMWPIHFHCKVMSLEASSLLVGGIPSPKKNIANVNPGLTNHHKPVGCLILGEYQWRIIWYSYHYIIISSYIITWRWYDSPYPPYDFTLLSYIDHCHWRVATLGLRAGVPGCEGRESSVLGWWAGGGRAGVSTTIVEYSWWCFELRIIGFVNGTIYRKPPMFHGKNMVSCRFSLKPI